MKRISIVFIATFCIKLGNAQSQNLKGTILPNNKNGNLFLPKASANQSSEQQENTSNIILVDGKMNPNKSGSEILGKNGNLTQAPTYISLTNGNYNGASGTVEFSPTASNKKTTQLTSNNTKKVASNSTSNSNSNLGSLTDNAFSSLTNDNSGNSQNNNSGASNNIGNLPSLTDGDTKPFVKSSTTIATSTNNYQANNQLAPLTDYAVKPSTTISSNLPKRNVETVDPSLMNGKRNINQTPNNQNFNGSKMPPLASINLRNEDVKNTSNKFSMPELAPIDGASQTKKNISSMPQLAAIEGLDSKSNLAKNGMPELAAIEQETNSTTNQIVMPELVSIDDDNNTNQPFTQTNRNYKQPKVKTNLKGLVMPPGTTLNATNKLSYIFKPISPGEENTIENIDELNSTKPSAGGGMGLPALTPIESVSSKNNISEIASKDETKLIVATRNLPTLAPIKPIVKYQQQQINTQNQTQQQLLQAAKNHQHDPNNPCCKVQIYKKPVAKKVAYKKPSYRYKRVYRQPVQQQVEYIYEQEPQQIETTERIVYVPAPTAPRQTKTIERIIYVPQPKQQNAPSVQKVYQPEAQQPVKQQDSRIVYRDYTNTYSKQIEKNNNSNSTNNSSQPLSKDGKKYYSPNNYAPNLVSGPTSGDYPVAGNTSDVNMKYSFYINGRGKYSVGLYNDYCSILLSQNGKVIEYKVNGDPKADPNSYKPRLNYFGSPETIAGIPIEYNYNRSVHKIGNTQFDYDFEGFFKNVGSSQVLYTSRSSLLSVDGVRVNYDAMGNVSNVDYNNGLIQYNPDNQSSKR